MGRIQTRHDTLQRDPLLAERLRLFPVGPNRRVLQRLDDLRQAPALGRIVKETP